MLKPSPWGTAIGEGAGAGVKSIEGSLPYQLAKIGVQSEVGQRGGRYITNVGQRIGAGAAPGSLRETIGQKLAGSGSGDDKRPGIGGAIEENAKGIGQSEALSKTLFK